MTWLSPLAFATSGGLHFLLVKLILHRLRPGFVDPSHRALLDDFEPGVDGPRIARDESGPRGRRLEHQTVPGGRSLSRITAMEPGRRVITGTSGTF
jgi:hypothetical protein